VDADTMDRLRAIALDLPGVSEGTTVHHPSFKVAGRAFAMVMEDHHGVGWTAVWLKSTRDEQAFLIESDGERFFAPPYVGPKGWIGYRFLANRPTDWTEVAELLEDAFRQSAGKRLIAQLDELRGGG
jgi:hypothetical protein